MKKKFKYKKDGKYYHIDIPEKEQEQFVIDNPDAEEVDTSTNAWMMDMDVYGLTEEEKKGVEEFEKEKEKELENKEIVEEEKKGILQSLEDPKNQITEEVDLPQDNQKQITEPIVKEHNADLLLETNQDPVPGYEPLLSVDKFTEVLKEQQEDQPKIDAIKANINEISVEDWNAMTETDKEQSVDGWEDLPFNEKQKIETEFVSQTPIEIQRNNDGFVTGVFGNMDLEDEMFWARGDWDHKEAYFDNFFEPLVNNGNYKVEVRGGGIKGIPGVIDNSIYGPKGGTPWDGTTSRASERNFYGIEITYTDPKTKETKKHTIYESDYEEAGQGKKLAAFLDKTMSDSDRIAVSKWQANAHQLYKTTSKEHIDVTDAELKEIEKEVNNMPFYGEDGEEGIYGTQELRQKQGNVKVQDDGKYGHILEQVQAETSNDLINWDELYKDKGGMYDSKLLKPSTDYKEKLKYYLDIGHITEEQYTKYVDDVMANKYFTFNEETGKYEGKNIPNPNQTILPDEKSLGKDQAIENHVRDEIIKLKVAELEEIKTGKYKDSIDSDDSWDTLFAIGSNINIRKAINENNVLLKKIENNGKKVNDETGLTINELQESVKKHEENFNNAEKVNLTFDPIQLYNEVGLLYGEGETEEEQQEDLQKKYDAKVDRILKDPENQIEINGDIIEATEEGYNAGGQRIIDKYTFPTQEEFDNKLKEIQGKLDSGKITNKQAEALWSEYQEEHIQNEKNLQTELENYDKEFQEQYDNVSNKINDFYKEQEDAAKIAEEKMKNWKEETQNFVFLEDGRKVSKTAFEEYKKHSEILGENYKIIDGYLNEQADLIANIDDDASKNYLIQKNYDDWEKFKFNVVTGFENMYMGTCYTLIKTVSNVTGMDDSWWSKNADQNYYNYQKAVEKLREPWQPDVKFGDAFDSWGNFGKFFTQEVGTQGPVFLTIMTGAPGLAALYSSGFAENYSRLVAEEIENPGKEYSQSYKFLTSMGYGGAEFVDAFITKSGITRSFKAFNKTFNKKTLASGWTAVGKEMKNQAIGGIPYVALDVGSEGLTTFLQNKIAGRPNFESVDHAMFSAGMFSLGFQLFPFIKGSVMTKFSDSKTLDEYKNNLKEITNIDSQLEKANIDAKTKKILEEQRVEIMGNNETILNEELVKLDNMSKEFTTTFFAHVNKSEQLRLDYDAIKADKTIDSSTKKKLLEKIEKDYNNNENLLTVLKTDAAFGEKFFGFENSTNKNDIKRRNEIFEQAKNELISEGKTDPSDATVRERARVLYNTQEILNDLAKTKKNGLAKDFKSYDTKQDAIEDINNMDISEADKTKLIEGIENGNHGATVTTNDGKKIPFQVVENMAQDSRLETRTHEKGHYVLEELFGENPQAFNDISSDIITHLQKHDPGNYLKLMTRVSGYDGDVKAEEVITNFMEMSAEGSIDLKSKKNKNLSSLIGFGFNNIFSNKTKGETSLDLQGQKDAVNFITQLGKKIKNGDINFRQTKKGRSLIDKETGRVIGKNLKKKYKKFKQEQSKTFKFSNPAEALNKLVPKDANTKAKFNKWINSKEGSEAIADMFYSENGVVRNTILKNANYNEDQANRTIDKIVDRIFGKTGFNPEATRADGSKVGAKAFGEYVMAGYSKDRIGTIKDMFKEGKLGPKRDISGDLVIGESGRTIFEKSEDEGGLSPEDLMVIKEETAADKKKTQETLTKVFGIDEKLITQFEGALTTAFGTKLPEVNSKQMRTELGKIISDRLRPIIQKKLGTELQFNEFIKNDLTPLLKFIKAEDLRQLERMVGGKKYPDGRKIFTRSKRITKKQEIIDLQNKGLIPKTFTKYAQGYNLATRLPNPTPQELLAFFRGTNAQTILDYQPPGSIKSGMLGARKDKLAELLTREIAFDQAIQVAKNVLPKIKAIESLQNRNIKENYIAELGLTLDRDPDAGSTNTDNSSVKFSRKANQTIINEIKTLTDHTQRYGIENTIDTDNNFLIDGIEDISSLAISTTLEMYDSNIILENESKGFKQFIYNSNAPQSLKDLLKQQGNLRFNTISLNQMHKDASAIAKVLGPDIMDILSYEILGYKNRFMDPAEQKTNQPKGTKGEFYDRLQALTSVVNSLNVKLPKNLKIEDVRIMNKSKSLFKRIDNILTLKSRSEKIEKIKALAPEIKAANKANIQLSKHIAKTIIDLAKQGKISQLSAVNILQAQTSIVSGFRGLSRLDLIDVREGSQALYINANGDYTNNKSVLNKGGVINTNNPQLNEAIIYYKSKGVKNPEQIALQQLSSKGEHVKPNSNTMFEVAELIWKDNVNIDTELDLIFNNHSQLLTSKYMADVIDDGPGGKTSAAEFKRINFLNEGDINSMIAPNGNSFQDVLIDREVSKLQKKIIRDASVKHSKSISMLNAKDNLIKFSKKPKTKGMSTFDFDDTLARTKSGVRYTMPNNTGKPTPGKKVIFLAGSAGSGKSNVVKQLGLEKQGFKMVNQDISLEWLAKNSGLPTDMRDFTPEQSSKWGSLQWEARDIAQRKATKFRGRGDGVVVDGTGASTISMFTQAQKYKDAGYDVQMLFVESSLETALERNKARKERSLQDFIVERNWKAVQKNKKAFKEEFGSNFAEVKTDKLKQGDPMPKSLVNKMDKFTNSYIKGRLTAEEFANKGGELLDQGAKFDFSEFNKVVDGTPGPLLEKARNRAKKYGTKDMFVLTARPQQSAFAIQQFLKGQGLDIPIKNITGLANSTGDAKAQWMLDKFAEGYNDMYFVDDAIQNVDAVKQVLDQLDVKSEVVQARVKFSKNASKEFNDIIEQSKGVGADVVISQAEAIKTGRHKGWWRLFVPPSAEDFKGLLYRFLGTGKQGEQHMEWFKENLLDPFAKGIRSWNVYKQGMVDEYKQLKKQFKDVKKSLFKNVVGTKFTVDSAIRVYLWDKAGFNIPGLDNATKDKLIEYVESNTKVKQYADALSKITRLQDGYIQPREGWSIGTVASDLNDIVNRVGRKEFLADYLANVDAIFTPDNLNKIQALYGTNFRKALDNILYRMENGTNRKISQDSNVNGLLDWINGSVGAIMFFNMRSASLQTLSTVNFINWTDNNLFKAGKAFANQPQFWKDFAMLFNSAQLKQRRRGLQTDVSASELSAAFSDGRATPRKVINYLLQLGFTPTQVVDSFAIAFGGASFYRNRFNTYKKRGMSTKEANDKAMLEFQELAEETQQSSREDMVSQQQASVLGRVVLAFQNTTMQYTRLTKKSLSDLANRRGDPKSHISRIMYYSAVQSIVFLSLQQALAASLWGDDEEEKDKDVKRVLNGTLESFLSGMGIHGKIASTIKNTIGVYKEQKAKGWNREDGKILLELLSFSPPIGSKLRKIYQAIRSEYYDSDGKLSEELGWRVENPKLYFWSSIIEAVFNIPTQRLVRKANNLEEAITGNHSIWERIQLGLGWSVWELGLEDEDTAEAKERIAEKKAIEKEKEKEQKKIEKEIEKEKEKIEEEKEKKEKGIKTVRCSGIRSNGERCGNTTETAEKTYLCYHHMEFTDGDDRDGDGIKEYRCTAIKKNGDRCKNKTENESKKCYAHQ